MMKRIKLSAFFLAVCIFCFGQGDFYTHPDWAKDATIYEVNLRQYTQAGTFKALVKSLPRLKELGVKILWIMPIYPIGELERKGTLGSYYAVKDYRDVNPEFGTMEDFKDLVQWAHTLGFKVILDWVANHSSPDNALTKEHPEWYKHDASGKIMPPEKDWTDVAGFNYKNNKGLWQYQIESMKYWVKEADVDGFRCDVAMKVPLEFWKEARTELDKEKKVFMLAEAEGPEFNRNGFDMTYGWELMSDMNDVAKGKKGVKDIVKLINKTDSLYKKSDYHMYFTTNHDENSWNGTEFERLGDGVKCFEVLCFTLPGMPLIYSGQESALNRRLKFFDKDPIDWGDYSMQGFYHQLVQLKKDEPELWNGADGGDLKILNTGNEHVLAYSRNEGTHQAVVVLNLSGAEQQYTIETLSGQYRDIFAGPVIGLNGSHSFNLGAWGYVVLVRQ